MSIQFEITESPRARSQSEVEQLLSDPGFGKVFTDHMIRIDWTVDGGWETPQVLPYGSLTLDPASAVLHYGQEIFEGLKAYRHADGRVYLFRPDQNAKRLNRSAERIALPELPEDLFVEACKQLVRADARWVPSAESGHSLYLRPFMIANETFLGVRSTHRATFIVIACPAGAYFKNSTEGVSIWVTTEFSRAGRGGTGFAKCGGNYAASLSATDEAYQHGCQQVLFLDGCEQRYLEELGGMNVFLVTKDGSLITPLSDSILNGITRNSIIELAEADGRKVDMRRVSLDEWRDGVASGEIVEAFACGTAAVVAPIARLKAEDWEVTMPTITEDSLSLRLRAELTGIQHGTRADDRGWMIEV